MSPKPISPVPPEPAYVPAVTDAERLERLQRALRERAPKLAKLDGFVWLDGMLPRHGKDAVALPRVEHGEAPPKRLRAWPDFLDPQTFAVFHGWLMHQLCRTIVETERAQGSPVYVQILRGTDWSGRETVAQSSEDLRVLVANWCLARGSLVFPAEPPLERPELRPVEPFWFRPSPSPRAARRRQGVAARRRRATEGSWTKVDLARAFSVSPAMVGVLVARRDFPAPNENGEGHTTWHPDDVRAWAAGRTAWGCVDTTERHLDFSVLPEVGDGPLLTQREALQMLGVDARTFHDELLAQTIPRVVLGPNVVRFPVAGLRIWQKLRES